MNAVSPPTTNARIVNLGSISVSLGSTINVAKTMKPLLTIPIMA